MHKTKTNMHSDFIAELQWRGLIHDIMPGTAEQLKKEMEDKLKSRIGVRANVELMEYGKIERTQFKARRVIDKRDLYK